MTRTDRPRTGKTVFHRDGTVTTWDCLMQQWVRGGRPSDDLLATMGADERRRIIRHTARPVATEADDLFAAVDEDGEILAARTFAYDELARLWYRRNWEHEAAGLVVLDLAYDEYADVGDFLDIDKDGVATLR